MRESLRKPDATATVSLPTDPDMLYP